MPPATRLTVSVVVPTFNRAGLLPETLDAILAQRHPPVEVIVIDDGSTDDTAQMLAARFGAAVRYRCIDNAGDLIARNAGLAMAQGDLVAFCDSDDLWRPGFLAAMMALWAVEPQTRVAFADFDIVRDGRWQGVRKFDAAPAGFWSGLRSVAPDGLGVFDTPIVERLLRFQPFFPSCMVADRRFLIGIGGWDTSVGRIVGTDFATALRLAEHAPFGVVRQPLVGIRKHAENFSGDVQAMNLGDARILEIVLAQRASLAPHAPAIVASIGRRRVQALGTAFERGDHAAVRAIFAMLPPGLRDAQTRLKQAAASLPWPLRPMATSALLGLGSIRAAIRPGSAPSAGGRAGQCAAPDPAQNPAAR